MTKTYKATGINLKGMPLGDNDRLLSILTPEYGLIKAIAPGARKYQSSLRGRSELFVVNELLLVKGRSLDKITQAETQESYPKLSQNLEKLTISQYLAELVLNLALSDQPQLELYSLFNEHLSRIEKVNSSQNLLPYLTHGVFHLLIIAGIAPQVHNCCITQKSLIPNFDNPKWQVGFSLNAGGIIDLSALSKNQNITINKSRNNQINNKLTALELTLLQNLTNPVLPDYDRMLTNKFDYLTIKNAWFNIEKIFRKYIEFHLDYRLRSAEVINRIMLY